MGLDVDWSPVKYFSWSFVSRGQYVETWIQLNEDDLDDFSVDSLLFDTEAPRGLALDFVPGICKALPSGEVVGNMHIRGLAYFPSVPEANRSTRFTD